MTTLAPCVSCRRHVRGGEHACPFCGVAIDATSEPAPRVVSERMTRSMLAVLGPAILVGAAASLEGCIMAVAHYGGAPRDLGTLDDAGPTNDTGADQ